MRSPHRLAIAVACGFLLAGCASDYSPESLVGGFSESKIGGDVWYVSYSGNGYTSEETVQTYWLYHCAELTLAKGYDGFEIVSPITLSSRDAAKGTMQPIRIQNRALNDYARVNKPWLDGRIRMLKRPFTAVPGRIFQAGALKAALGGYVTGKKCGGNVCPHVHSYLYSNS